MRHDYSSPPIRRRETEQGAWARCKRVVLRDADGFDSHPADHALVVSTKHTRLLSVAVKVRVLPGAQHGSQA